MRMMSHPGSLAKQFIHSPLVLQEILVMAPKLQEDGMVQIISWVYIYVPYEFQNKEPGAMRDGHGTRDCKRCPSTSLYELLSLNS